VYTPSIKK